MAHQHRIAAKFRELKRRDEAALIPFVVAGDPDIGYTRLIVRELEACGADLIELGMPFSDPMADGPANQRANARALASGASLTAILALISELRKETEIPLIPFGYYNPILHYGCARFCADAASAGADGILIVDLPPEESGELAGPARKAGLDIIRLLAPTTPLERARRIARSASGFLYYVSVAGVTGVRAQLPADLEANVRELRTATNLPIGVGFGISTPEQAGEVAAFADAVVVGSALSLTIEKHGKSADTPAAAGALIEAMKRAIRGARHRVGDAMPSS